MDSPNPPTATQWNTQSVDWLRGAAILMVVAYHVFGQECGWFVPWSGWTRDFSAASSSTLVWLYPMTLGWVGVSLFFVISGFCIHYSFLRRGSFSSREFFWRRFWRICPAYLAALVVFAVATQLDPTTTKGVKQLGSHLGFAHNFSRGTFFGINPSFWSIATEVQLYALFPLLLMIRARIGMTGCLATSLVVGCVWRLVSSLAWGPARPLHLLGVGLTADDLV